MSKIDLLPCPFCCGKAETSPLDKCDSYGNHERLWYSECGECFARGGYYNTEGEAAIAWNARVSGWIPCSERLPKRDGFYLAYYTFANGRHACDMVYFNVGATISISITHWMPLPEPPEVTKNVG